MPIYFVLLAPLEQHSIYGGAIFIESSKTL